MQVHVLGNPDVAPAFRSALRDVAMLGSLARVSVGHEGWTASSASNVLKVV